ENVPSAWRRWLYAGNPEGSVKRANLRWTGAEDFDVDAAVDGLGWGAVDKLPGARGVRGVLLGDQQALTVELPPRNELSVEEPGVFRQPFAFSKLAGTLAAYRTESSWRLETDALAFEGTGYGGELRGALDLPDAGGRPLIDAYAVVEHGIVPASHLF